MVAHTREWFAERSVLTIQQRCIRCRNHRERRRGPTSQPFPGICRDQRKTRLRRLLRRTRFVSGRYKGRWCRTLTGNSLKRLVSNFVRCARLSAVHKVNFSNSCPGLRKIKIMSCGHRQMWLRHQRKRKAKVNRPPRRLGHPQRKDLPRPPRVSGRTCPPSESSWPNRVSHG